MQPPEFSHLSTHHGGLLHVAISNASTTPVGWECKGDSLRKNDQLPNSSVASGRSAARKELVCGPSLSIAARFPCVVDTSPQGERACWLPLDVSTELESETATWFLIKRAMPLPTWREVRRRWSRFLGPIRMFRHVDDDLAVDRQTHRRITQWMAGNDGPGILGQDYPGFKAKRQEKKKKIIKTRYLALKRPERNRQVLHHSR